MTQEALKMALQVLEDCVNSYGMKYERPAFDKAITAMKEALAQHDSVQAKPEPEQEPVAWMDVDGKTFPFVWNVSSLGVQQGSKYLDETLTPLYTHPQWY